MLLALLHQGMAPPALIIGMPVGFVDAAESKEALLSVECPYITIVGPKGGSALAASALNALAILAETMEAAMTSASGILYGIGVGPGDPELITLKALHILERVPYVFAAASTKNDYSLALNIVRHYIAQATVEPIYFPMTSDRQILGSLGEECQQGVGGLATRPGCGFPDHRRSLDLFHLRLFAENDKDH